MRYTGFSDVPEVSPGYNEAHCLAHDQLMVFLRQVCNVFSCRRMSDSSVSGERSGLDAALRRHRHIVMQVVSFLGISGIGWILDFALFNLLHLRFESVFFCNLLSVFVATTFVFLVSTRKTFVQRPEGVTLKMKFLLYALYQIVLTFAVSEILDWTNSALIRFLLPEHLVCFAGAMSKVAVTPIAMFCNFCTLKLLVEKL